MDGGKSAANEEPLALVDQVHGAQPPTEGGGAAKRVGLHKVGLVLDQQAGMKQSFL